MNSQLLLAHESFVRGLARSLLADEATAEDVVQDTWLAALRRPPDSGSVPPDEGRIRSWLARVVRNFAKQEHRGGSRRSRRERENARPEAIPSTAEIAAIEAARRRLVDAVLALEEPVRSAILLRFYRDEPPRAIARRIGVPVETVRSRLKRGLTQLRERLGGGDADAPFFRAAPFLAVARLPFGEIAGGATATSATLAAGGLLVKTTMKVAALVLILIGGLAVLSPLLLDELAGPRKARETQSPAGLVSSGAQTAKAEAAEPARPARPDPIAEKAEVAGPAIRGIVVDPAGRAVAGATIVAFPASMNGPVGPDDATSEGPVRRGVSGKDGRFALAIDPTAPLLSLVADAPRLSAAFVRGVLPSDDVTMRLDAPRVVTGRVRELGGRPIAGAKVTWLGALGSARLEKSGVSGPDGAYRIEGFPSIAALRTAGTLYSDHWFEVVAEGFAPYSGRFDFVRRRSADPAPLLDVWLPRGATLRGRVLDAETREPIPRAPVVLWTSDGGEGYRYREVAKTITDEQGRYTIERVQARGVPSPATGPEDGDLGVAEVAAMPPGHAGATAPVPLTEDGGALEADLACWPVATVEGRLVDPGGNGIADATVQCRTTVERRGGWFPPRYADVVLRGFAKTDASGRYVIRGCAAIRGEASPATVEAFDPAYGRVIQGSNESRPSASVTVRAGETTRAPDLVLAPFPSALIRVKDVEGRPVAGARLRWGYGHMTGSDGTCRIPYGPSAITRTRGAPADVLVEARGYARTLASMPLPPPETGFEVVLRKGLELKGRVVDANGAPATKVNISVVNPAADPEARAATRHIFESRDSVPGALVVFGTAYTADESSFTVSGLPEGPYEVVAVRHRQPIWGGRRSEVSAVVPAVATGTTDLVIQLPPERPEEATYPLDGDVVDAKTLEPLLAFEATILRPGSMIAAVQLAPGKFRFDAVPGGTWRIKVSAKGYAAFEQEGIEIRADRPQKTSVQAAMHRGVTVQGRVIAPPDVDLGKLQIRFCKRGLSPLKSCTVEKDGSYRIQDLPPGSYAITTTGSQGSGFHTFLARDTSEPIVLSPDEPVATRDLRFSAAGNLRITLTGARVPKNPWELDSATDAEIEVAEKSRCEIRSSRDSVVWAGAAFDQGLGALGLLAGDYRVRVTLPGAEPQEKAVTLKTGEVARLTFEFP